jgi:GR25 family glycosyltransferase involved in LPS biosynthesis
VINNINNSLIDVDYIYICHWDKLVERKHHILEQLKIQDIKNYSFVTLYDTENWNIEQIKKDYPFIFNKDPKDNRFLKMSEISLLLKHCWCIYDAYNKKYDSIMILEDDVVFCNNFINYFNNFKNQLPKDWDCSWVGGCCNLYKHISDTNINVYPSNTSRCCHCYILSKDGINKIVKEIKNINQVIDWYFNDIIPRLGLNAFWFEPPLAIQSSVFNSTVQI